MAVSKERVEELEEKIRNADKEIMEANRREQRLNKEQVMHCMEQNPETLFSCVSKAERKTKSEMGPFNLEGKYENDTRIICKMLINTNEN